MSVVKNQDIAVSAIPVQIEVPLNENEKPEQRKTKQLKSKKRPSHRKPPRSDYDATSPLGVLTSFEIPHMLATHHKKVCEVLGYETEISLKDVINPVRDIINDAGVKDAFNWREVHNVEVLCMSAKGDGLAVIRAPTYEHVLKCQSIAHEREKLEMENLEVEELNDGRRRKKVEPYRRTVIKENMPKVQIATVPFAFPGDIVNIKIYHTNTHFVESEVVSFVRLSPLRGGKKPEDSACAYFGLCSGCQYQSIGYEHQLEIKREVVENAFRHFCKNEIEWEGKVLDTVASPLEFGYRTKLTPHYDVPRSGNEGLDVPRLGFGWKSKGSWMNLNKTNASNRSSKDEPWDNSELPLEHPMEIRESMRERSIRPYFGDVLDIEDCIIGTDIVRLGLVNERKRLAKEWRNGERSKKGVTVLLREHNIIKGSEGFEDRIFGSCDEDGTITKIEEGEIIKTCVTDNQKIVSDLVDTGFGNKLRFDFIANEFFQNNNSILPKVIKYVRDNLGNEEEFEYLVDAYCGSGLFSVAIASDRGSSVKKVLGVEISERATEFAKRNAELNFISNERCSFVQGKAEKLFDHIDFPRDKTGVILDPPRKGCDDIFLKQLSEFEPNRIVYVSCNVHSQARDVKYFLNESINGNKYEIESIRGFDFFPQTHHVESVVVLVHK